MGRRTRAKTSASAPAGRKQAAPKGKRHGRRSRMRWLGWLAAAALAVVVLRALPGAASGAPRVGAEAPALKVKTLDGQKLSLAELRGKVVLVNFWATWCPPCRAEMPGFESVWRERQKDGFVVVGLSADDGSGQVALFLGDQGITYPVAMASASAKRAFGGVNALPSSFLIDKQGKVRRQVQGVFDERLLRQDVNRLLAE